MPTKVCLVKAIVFAVVMYGCERWTIKKAECWRIDAFELWCWRRLFRVPWTARRSNQSILKEISPEYSLDWRWRWNSNTLAAWCEELTHWKRPWCWERLKEEGEGDDRGWDDWMALPTCWTWVWASSRTWWWTGKPGVLQSMGSLRVRHDWATGLNRTSVILVQASLVAQLVKNPSAMQEILFDSWVGLIPWRRERIPPPLFWPGEFRGLYSLWGCKESDATEWLWLSLFISTYTKAKPKDKILFLSFGRQFCFHDFLT